MIGNKCQTYLSYVVDSTIVLRGIKDISVTCEFPDIFLEDLKLYKQERSNKHVNELAKYYEP